MTLLDYMNWVSYKIQYLVHRIHRFHKINAFGFCFRNNACSEVEEGT